MSKLKIISDLIKSKYHITDAKLVEKEKDQKGNSFTMIRNIIARDGDFIVVKLDNSKNIFPFFNEITGVEKLCDYILFYEENQQLYSFVIELKLGNLPCNKQLESGICLTNFILCTCQRLNPEIDFNSNIRKIKIIESRSNKRKIKKYFEVDESNTILETHPKDFHIQHYLYQE